ncbi:MAG TPA: ATP-binding protein [Terriglobia bacterium]|nr:ATP-binding protein [Terriglobia bacterium]
MNSRTRLPEYAPQLALPWIVRLRYGMALAQIVTALVVHYVFRIELPLGWIALAPIVTCASNLWLARRVHRPDLPSRIPTANLVAGIFVLDIVCLTGLLMSSGGPTNPFSLLYLVHITLAATILTKRQTWLLAGLSILGFGLLFWFYRPITVLEVHLHEGTPNYHLMGMWVSFATAVFLVALFAAKIAELLGKREESLLRMQEELAKKDRLASLVTLAAGAAHELGTPLSTIAVVAKEMELYAGKTARNDSLVEDSRLIRTEVDRCREILRRMQADGAEPGGEAAEAVAIQSLLQALAAEFPLPARSRLVLTAQGDQPVLTIPRQAVLQALVALVRNALEASGPNDPVEMRVHREGEFVRFVIVDHGSGMSSETLRRIGEPFFTTKDQGKGMGLGVFLVRTLAERLGGRLTFRSTPGTGTVATLELPAQWHPELVCE